MKSTQSALSHSQLSKSWAHEMTLWPKALLSEHCRPNAEIWCNLVRLWSRGSLIHCRWNWQHRSTVNFILRVIETRLFSSKLDSFDLAKTHLGADRAAVKHRYYALPEIRQNILICDFLFHKHVSWAKMLTCPAMHLMCLLQRRSSLAAIKAVTNRSAFNNDYNFQGGLLL